MRNSTRHLLHGRQKEYPVLSTLDEDVSARELIVSLAEDIIAEFEHLTLIDKYDVYQVLLPFGRTGREQPLSVSSVIFSESPDCRAGGRYSL